MYSDAGSYHLEHYLLRWDKSQFRTLKQTNRHLQVPLTFWDFKMRHRLLEERIIPPNLFETWDLPLPENSNVWQEFIEVFGKKSGLLMEEVLRHMFLIQQIDIGIVYLLLDQFIQLLRLAVLVANPAGTAQMLTEFPLVKPFNTIHFPALIDILTKYMRLEIVRNHHNATQKLFEPLLLRSLHLLCLHGNIWHYTNPVVVQIVHFWILQFQLCLESVLDTHENPSFFNEQPFQNLLLQKLFHYWPDNFDRVRVPFWKYQLMKNGKSLPYLRERPIFDRLSSWAEALQHTECHSPDHLHWFKIPFLLSLFRKNFIIIRVYFRNKSVYFNQNKHQANTILLLLGINIPIHDLLTPLPESLPPVVIIHGLVLELADEMFPFVLVDISLQF